MRFSFSIIAFFVILVFFIPANSITIDLKIEMRPLPFWSMLSSNLKAEEALDILKEIFFYPTLLSVGNVASRVSNTEYENVLLNSIEFLKYSIRYNWYYMGDTINKDYYQDLPSLLANSIFNIMFYVPDEIVKKILNQDRILKEIAQNDPNLTKVYHYIMKKANPPSVGVGQTPVD